MTVQHTEPALAKHLDAADARRRILTRNTYNARDAGDYPISTAGGWMRPGVLFRADALAYLDEREIEEATGLGIRLVVDLRDPHERDNAADRVIPGAENVSIMLFEGTLASFPPEDYPGLPELYRLLLTTHIHRIVETLERIAAVLPEPVLIHCTAGKDRTGITVALLQALAGVPQEIILQDYSVSEQLLGGGGFSRRVERLFDEAGIDRRVIGPEPIASPGRYLGEALTGLAEVYGSIEEFLVSSGLSERAIDRIKRSLVAER